MNRFRLLAAHATRTSLTSIPLAIANGQPLRGRPTSAASALGGGGAVHPSTSAIPPSSLRTTR